MMTFVSLGPIGWFFVDVLSEKYDRLLQLFVISIICAVLSTVFWINALRLPKWDDEDESDEDVETA